MVKNWLPLAALTVGGLVALSLAKQGSAAQYLSAKVDSVKVASMNLLQSIFTVRLLISNPSNIDIAFDSMNAKVYLDSTQIADVLVNGNGQNIILKKFADTALTFPVKMSNTGVGLKLYKLIIETPEKLTLTSQGLVDSGVITIPFSTAYAVPLRSKKEGVSGIAGIGSTEVKLKFASNQEMEDYFSPLRDREIRISKS